MKHTYMNIKLALDHKHIVFMRCKTTEYHTIEKDNNPIEKDNNPNGYTTSNVLIHTS